MNPTFNPYRQWLGIAEHELPPNLYRLLGLNQFEQDRALIAHAADRVIAYVRTIPPGPQVVDWQRLLDELSQAKSCLTDPDQKARYDAHLQQSKRAAARPATAPVAVAPTWSQPAAYPAPVQPAYPTAHPGPAPAYPAPQAGWAQPAMPVGGPPLARPIGGPMPMAMGAPVANPMAPVAAAPSAVPSVMPMNTIEQPVVGAPRPRTTTVLRRRQRSKIPILLFLAAAAGGLGYAFVAVLNREKPPAQIVVVKAPPAPPVPQSAAPAVNGERVPTQPTSPQKRLEDKPVKLTKQGGIKVPGLKYEENAEQSPPISITPQMTKPGEAGDAEGMKPEDKPAVPEGEAPPAAPMPEPQPKAMPEPTPQQAAAFDKAIASAFESLSSRDRESAARHLQAAEKQAISEAQKSRLRGMRTVDEGVGQFWSAVRTGLKGLIGTAEELELKQTRVAVIEAGEDFLILRIAGQNRTFKLDSMPVGLAVLLANRWFEPNDPANKIAIGSFLLVDPMGDKAEARRNWEEAANGGLDVSDLLPLLEIKP